MFKAVNTVEVILEYVHDMFVHIVVLADAE